MQVSLSVTVGRDATPGATVRFWAIEAGAETPVSRETVQKIKLVLTPIDTQAPRGPGGKPRQGTVQSQGGAGCPGL